MPASAYQTLIIRRIIPETRNTKTLVLETKDGSPLDYLPGQFLTLVFPKKEKEERRSYSISSASALGEPLSITIRRIDNGEFSRQLIDYAREGDELLTSGVSGFFTLPEDRNAAGQLFFFAAGSGITPMLPMIKTALHFYPQQTLVLIYSNRSQDDTIFFEELLALREKFAERFRLDFLYSSAQDLTHARLGKWLIDVLIKKYLDVPREKALFYLCGPYDYMRMARIELMSLGMPEENIRKEIFFTLPPINNPKPPDEEKHRVEIRTAKETAFIDVQYPQTILHAALKKGIVLPYSCESGQCGSCAATCIKGEVWMSYNEVLTEKELAEGRVLTCTGFPVGGDVLLQFET